jgi:hypothetical protein
MFGFAGFAGSALAMAILGGAPLRLAGRVLAVAGGLLMVVWVAAISGVVFGEDTYISDGSSRWLNRGASEHTLYFVTTTIALAVAALLGIFAIRNVTAARVRGVLLPAGFLALFVGWWVLVTFVAN